MKYHKRKKLLLNYLFKRKIIYLLYPKISCIMLYFRVIYMLQQFLPALHLFKIIASQLVTNCHWTKLETLLLAFFTTCNCIRLFYKSSCNYTDISGLHLFLLNSILVITEHQILSSFFF